VQGFVRSIGRLLAFLSRWEPSRRPSGSELDWLPPVLGPADWSSGLLASMADKSAAWYFDREARDA
jgi:hypothetical protein